MITSTKNSKSMYKNIIEINSLSHELDLSSIIHKDYMKKPNVNKEARFQSKKLKKEIIVN